MRACFSSGGLALFILDLYPRIIGLIIVLPISLASFTGNRLIKNCLGVLAHRSASRIGLHSEVEISVEGSVLSFFDMISLKRDLLLLCVVSFPQVFPLFPAILDHGVLRRFMAVLEQLELCCIRMLKIELKIPIFLNYISSGQNWSLRLLTVTPFKILYFVRVGLLQL